MAAPAFKYGSGGGTLWLLQVTCSGSDKGTCGGVDAPIDIPSLSCIEHDNGDTSAVRTCKDAPVAIQPLPSRYEMPLVRNLERNVSSHNVKIIDYRPLREGAP